MKKILYLFVFVFFFCCFFNVSAFQVENKLITQLGSTSVTDIVPSKDGGFIVAGNYMKYPDDGFDIEYGEISYFIGKYDANMNKLWEYNVDSEVYIYYTYELNNGNVGVLMGYEEISIFFILNGENGTIVDFTFFNSIMLFFIEDNQENIYTFGAGICEFESTCVYDEDMFITDFYKTEDSYYLLVNNYANGQFNASIITFDLDGDIIWIYEIKNNDKSEVFLDITVDMKGNIVIGGVQSESADLFEGPIHPLGVKLDDEGNLLNEACVDFVHLSYPLILLEFDSPEFQLDFLIYNSAVSIEVDKNNNYIVALNYFNMSFLTLCDENFNIKESILEQDDLDYNYAIVDLFKIDDKVYFNNFYVDSYFNGKGDENYFENNVVTQVYEINYNYELEKKEETDAYDIEIIDNKGVITLNPEEGFILEEIVIKDKNGNIIPFEKIDDKYYVELKDDYVVEVKYKEIVKEDTKEDTNEDDGVDNPLTLDFVHCMLISFVILVLLLIVSSNLRIKRYYN